MKKDYKVIVCGGTFDLLHRGHKAFINFMLDRSENVLLGLTSDIYTKKFKHNEEIAPYTQRRRGLENYFADLGLKQRVTIEPIQSVYIPSIWNNKPIEAIFATENTRKGALLVNKKREKEKKELLPIQLFPYVLAQDNLPISSHRIRKGEINRDGELWINPLWFHRTIILPEEKRSLYQKPFGKVYKNFSDIIALRSDTCFTVGDVTTSLAYRNGASPRVSVVDFIVERKKKFNSLQELGLSGRETIHKIQNPPGHLTPLVFNTFAKIIKNIEKQKIDVVLIDGEEDLCVLPLVLFAPLRFIILYGQPKKGTVRLVVTEETKRRAKQLLDHFKISHS